MSAYRDQNGHFISEEEARRRGLIGGGSPPRQEEPAPEPVEEDGDDNEGEDPVEEVATGQGPVPAFGQETRAQATSTGTVFVDTGRGQGVQVQAGSPFVTTLNRLADEAHYGGYFRIFLNGSELVNPEDSPETIEVGQRIAITSYDKVG